MLIKYQSNIVFLQVTLQTKLDSIKFCIKMIYIISFGGFKICLETYRQLSLIKMLWKEGTKNMNKQRVN